MLYQFMPRLSDDEYAKLEQSIREHGIQVPVLVDENGSIIDGHHRREIATRLGIECPEDVRAGLSDAAKRTLALSLNIDRRHLNREQKRALVEASLKADPELSDREHARRTSSSPTTVGTVRDELESTVQIGQSDKRVSADGRERPSTQPTRPEQPKPKRRALTDFARDAGWDIRKAAERLTRIREDDRFSRNQEEVAAHLRSHLMFVIETCQGMLDDFDESKEQK